MKNVTNAINTMLHVHQASDAAMKDSVLWQEPTSTMSMTDDEQAVSAIEHCIQNFGAEAVQELEEHVESLQEEFLAHVTTLLAEQDIHMDEKLVLSLSSDNTLLLQCQEQEEALLAALGEDALLRTRLQELRATAFLARGLQYMLAAREEKAPSTLAEYNVCVKGKLSHFYLK